MKNKLARKNFWPLFKKMVEFTIKKCIQIGINFANLQKPC